MINTLESQRHVTWNREPPTGGPIIIPQPLKNSKVP